MENPELEKAAAIEGAQGTIRKETEAIAGLKEIMHAIEGIRKANMDDTIQKVVDLIHASALDQTIKDILIRDLQSEGLTDFLREQIKAYCLEGIEKSNARIEEAKKVLESYGVKDDQNPA